MDHHNRNLAPTVSDLEADDAFIRRVLLEGEYHAFMERTSGAYLHRVIAAARREGYDRGMRETAASQGIDI